MTRGRLTASRIFLISFALLPLFRAGASSHVNGSPQAGLPSRDEALNQHGIIRGAKNSSSLTLDRAQVEAQLRECGAVEIDARGTLHLSGDWSLPEGTIRIHASGGVVADDWRLSSPGSKLMLDGPVVRLRGRTLLNVARPSGRGGNVALIGGTSQGIVEVGARASIDAGGSAGQGGHIMLSANDVQARGDLLAMGGGLIEVEARAGLRFLSHADTGGGLIRLDPTNLVINSGSDTDVTAGTDKSPNNSPNTGFVDAAALATLLNTNSVVVHTTGVACACTGLQTSITGDATSGDISVEAAVIWNSAFSLTLLAHDDLIVLAPVQNLGSGNVVSVSGWNGTEPAASFTGSPAPLPTAASYGNTGGDTFVIGTSNPDINVAFGSRDGTTAVWAYNVKVQGSTDADSTRNGFAMIGFSMSDGTAASGPIQVLAHQNVSLLGGSSTTPASVLDERFAQIGHGGGVATGTTPGTTQGNLSGAITVNAGGDLLLDDGDESNYAQIGHGGFEVDHVTRGNLSGDIVVSAVGVTLKSETGLGSYVQIGHGGNIINASTEGDLDGKITINATSLSLLSGTKALTGGAKIGHGSSVVCNLGNRQNPVVGNIGSHAASPILVMVTNDTNLSHVLAPSISGLSQIGHGGQIVFGGTLGTMAGDITLTAGGNVVLSSGADCLNFCGSQIGHTALQATVFGSSVGAAQGDVKVTAGGSVSVTGGGATPGGGSFEYAQIGHGGALIGSQDAFGGTVGTTSWAGAPVVSGNTNDVTVDAQNVTVQGGAGFCAYAQIGNGGVLQSDENTFSHVFEGALDGAVRVTSRGDLLVAAGADIGFPSATPPYPPGAYAQIGNGGENASQPNNTTVAVTGASGAVSILVAHETSLVDDPAGSMWWLGHRTAGTLTGSPVVLDTGTLDFVAGGPAATNATISDPNFWNRFVADPAPTGPEKANAAGGSVTLRVHGLNLSASDGNLISNQPLTIPAAISNPVHVLSTDDLTFNRPVANNGSSVVDLVADDANPNPPNLSPSALLNLGGTFNVTAGQQVRLFAVAPSQFNNASSYIPPAQKFGIWYQTLGTPVVGVNFKATPDISLVKTLITSGPFTVGQMISYTLVVANIGTATATNIQVTDTPTQLTITTVTGGCVVLPCTIASLAPSVMTAINVTATINAAGAFDNSATATPAEPDLNPANNTDNTGNGGTAASSADVSLVKTLVTPGPYFASQTISYTLVVANAGPSTATNIQVTDIPTNLTITNVTGSGCAALPCTIVSLAAGVNTTINVVATITAAGPFDNSATATSAVGDPNISNNTDNAGNGGAAGPASDIPAVSGLGLILMVSMLAAAGAMVTRVGA
jgi:uncharacterized repeat protein (TIGR01451 family)